MHSWCTETREDASCHPEMKQWSFRWLLPIVSALRSVNARLWNISPDDSEATYDSNTVCLRTTRSHA